MACSIAQGTRILTSRATGSAYQIAEAYAYRGETGLAFEWLERAYAQRSPSLVTAKVTLFVGSNSDQDS